MSRSKTIEIVRRPPRPDALRVRHVLICDLCQTSVPVAGPRVVPKDWKRLKTLHICGAHGTQDRAE